MVQSPAREREVVRGRLPAARRDRRPALAALAVLLILLGALGSALIAFRSGDRVSVLVAAQAIKPGETVKASDFKVAKVAGDTDTMLRSSRIRDVIEARALVGVPQGAFVTGSMFSKDKVVPDGAEEVGVTVSSRQRPGSIPQADDIVRLYFVTSETAQSGTQAQFSPGDPVVAAARVIGVSSGGTAGTGGTANVTVVVKRSLAGVVASLSANGNLAITKLPADTEPDVDLVSPGE